MARDFYIPGQSLVLVKGNVNSSIAALSQLGLASDQIRVSFELRQLEIAVNAFGNLDAGGVPAEIQNMLAACTISMNLVHVDAAVLQAAFNESLGAGAVTFGTMPRTGARLGNNSARFTANNHYVGLNIACPVGPQNFRFLYSYMTGSPIEIPLGTERSEIAVQFRAIPYPEADPDNPGDPWGAGLGSLGCRLFDNVLDT